MTLRPLRSRALLARWAALSLVAFALCGGGFDRHDRPGIERILEHNAERLQLDAATREQIRALAVAGRERSRPLREELHRQRDELRALLSSDAPDAGAVMQKAEQIGDTETAVSKERLRTMLEIRALLTTEQRRELVRIHEEFRERRKAERGGDRWRDRGEPE